MKKLPKTLYVRWEQGNKTEAPWLVTGETARECLEDPDDQKEIGVYELRKMIVAKSTVSISVQAKASRRTSSRSKTNS